MTPASAIDMLDRQIAEHGQNVAFRRGTAIVAVKGFVRGFKPEALAGLLTQADRQVTISPTGLGSYGAPRKNDDVSLDGALGVVKAAEEIKIGTTPVRYNLTVTMT